MPGPPTGTVTFLFTDIEGSTRLWEQKPDTMQRPLGQHRLRDLPERETIFQLVPPGLPGEFPALNTLDVAFRRGVMRAAGVAMVILTVMAALALTAMYQARRAEERRVTLRRYLY